MILNLGKQIDPTKYVSVDSEMTKELHKMGFQPIYRDLDFDKVYFVRTEEILNAIRKLHMQD